MDSAVLLHLASLAWRVMAPSCSLEGGLDNSKTELVTLKSTVIFIMYALMQCLSFSERTAGTLHKNWTVNDTIKVKFLGLYGWLDNFTTGNKRFNYTHTATATNQQRFVSRAFRNIKSWSLINSEAHLPFVFVLTKETWIITPREDKPTQRI